jgi:hypothetical protein
MTDDEHRIPPTCGAEWLALAQRLADEGQPDEAAFVRVYWWVLSESLAAGMTFDVAMRLVTKHAPRLGRLAREAEERSLDR